MWYAEIDENGRCFALSYMSENDIPTLIKLDKYQDVLGWTWNGETWVAPEPQPEPSMISTAELDDAYREGVNSYE